MGLLDLFTGAASERAAKNNQSTIATGLTQTGTALQDTSKAALGYLLDGSNPSALTSLGSGYGQARQDLGSQYSQTQSLLGEQQGLYSHMADTGRGAFDAYANAVGANGAAGSAQATQDFRAAPGYEYQRDQALDAVQRSAAARGGLAGGNTTNDILRAATGLADSSYQQYISNLGNAASSYGTALSGQAAGLGAQANASQNYGTQLSALGTGLGTAQAGVYGLGAGVQQNLGNQTAASIANATNAYVGNNNNLAASENAAGANILNGALGVAGLFASPAGAAAGRAGGGSAGGNILSALGGLFK